MFYYKHIFFYFFQDGGEGEDDVQCTTSQTNENPVQPIMTSEVIIKEEPLSDVEQVYIKPIQFNIKFYLLIVYIRLVL